MSWSCGRLAPRAHGYLLGNREGPDYFDTCRSKQLTIACSQLSFHLNSSYCGCCHHHLLPINLQRRVAIDYLVCALPPEVPRQQLLPLQALLCFWGAGTLCRGVGDVIQWPHPERLALRNGYHSRLCLCRQLSDLRRGQVSSWPSRRPLVLHLPMSQL